MVPDEANPSPATSYPREGIAYLQVDVEKELYRALYDYTGSQASSPGAVDYRDPNTFHVIGSGNCGVVLGGGDCSVMRGCGTRSMAFKLGKDFTNEVLWDEYLKYMVIAGKINARNVVGIRVPNPIGFVPADRFDFWELTGVIEAAYDVCDIPADTLITEKIPPVPMRIRNLLLSAFCPEELKAAAASCPANNDCLLRIYLGSYRHTPIDSSSFSLRNFTLHLGQLIDIKLGEDFLSTMAANMAIALAVMHWDAKTDARDVEFALGGSLNPMSEDTVSQEEGHQSSNSELEPARKITLWILDFDQVRPITMDSAGVTQAAEAFIANDPFCPRPLQESYMAQRVWDAFVWSYLTQAEALLVKSPPKTRQLPSLFINRVVEIQRKQMEQKNNEQEDMQ
ncbi:hypothetical protein FZEAL_3539 [Fusarium zealandicum]|uniref:DUF3669 domain-containing protein n=1 Tax=Fusarium zealandicum TaxID=1053134 RepID=A0A8H4UNG8_9HYPO|nr:hypothetical protein FZEAL_3539 [Fusarium zealandicum]